MFMAVFSMTEFNVLSPNWGLEELPLSNHYSYCAQLPLENILTKKDCSIIQRLLKNGYRFNGHDLPKDTILLTYCESEMIHFGINLDRFGVKDDDNSVFMYIYCRIMVKKAPDPGVYLLFMLPDGTNSFLFDTARFDVQKHLTAILDDYRKCEIMVRSIRFATDSVNKMYSEDLSTVEVKTILESSKGKNSDNIDDN